MFPWINVKQMAPFLKVIFCSLLLLLLLSGCRREVVDVTVTPPIAQAATVTATAVVADTHPPPVTTTAPEPEATATEATATEATATEATATTDPPTVVPTATEIPPAEPVTMIQLALVVSGFTRPTYLTHAFDERLFVVEQPGRIQIVAGGQTLPGTFLDIEGRVGSRSNEQGLFSVAFHPHYLHNGRFFVNYTNRDGDTVISRFQVSAGDPNRADEDSEVVLMVIGQPYSNHNGGQLKFGPDGYLYVGMGDGGSSGDPQNHGQNGATLLGALLRLDVDHSDENANYAIPADNPFIDVADHRNEIWAIGLRNPWRFTFDRLTDDLFVADVGQNAWEEVNFRPAGAPGGDNYGWNIMEGSRCFRDSACDSSGLIMPVAEYGREGGCSITGGYVYRGRQYPGLNGNYFFADYCLGFIWSLVQRPDGNWLQTQVLNSGLTISSFGEDVAGELYLLDHGAGAVYQIRE